MIRVNLVRWSSARFFLLWMSQCSVDVGNFVKTVECWFGLADRYSTSLANRGPYD